MYQAYYLSQSFVYGNEKSRGRKVHASALLRNVHYASSAPSALAVSPHRRCWPICSCVHYAATSKGQPTFVNLDKPYPDQPFTILIWASDLAKFNPGPISWDKKRVCATGTITSYQGMPEIVAKAPGQVSLGEPKK